MVTKATATRRTVIAALALGVVIAISCYVTSSTWQALLRRPAVTHDHFERIAVGMTKADVAGLFGSQGLPHDDGYSPKNGPTRKFRWETKHAYAAVEFDRAEIVVAKEWWKNIPRDETMWELVQRVACLRSREPSNCWHLELKPK